MKALSPTPYYPKELEDREMGSNTSRFAGDVQDLGQDPRKLDEKMDQKSVHNLQNPEATRREKEELNPSLVGEKENWRGIIAVNEKLLGRVLALAETGADPRASEECGRQQWEEIVAIDKELQAHIKEITESSLDLEASKWKEWPDVSNFFKILLDELRLQSQDLHVALDKISRLGETEEDTPSPLQDPDMRFESMKRKLEFLSLPEEFCQVLNKCFGIKKTL